VNRCEQLLKFKNTLFVLNIGFVGCFHLFTSTTNTTTYLLNINNREKEKNEIYDI